MVHFPGRRFLLVAEVKAALQACAAWHKTPQVVVRYATNPGLAERLSDYRLSH
jgi:hypothetical protein